MDTSQKSRVLMSDIGTVLMKTPYGDPYWDMVGMLDSKKVVGHQMTDEEWREYECSLWCFSPWKVDYARKIIWRYWAE
jgi:hypothetical protein